MSFKQEVKSSLIQKRKILKANKNSQEDVKSPYFSSCSLIGCPTKKRQKYEVTPKSVLENDLRLYRPFYMQPCVTLAKDLLGKILVRKLSSGELLKGMIVETESYLGIIDKASHSFDGKRTDRNEAMFLNPGTAYVYSIYGMYYCFNISSLEEGSAVLIRAIEPLEGLITMQGFRSKAQKTASKIKQKDLCNGPSKLCQAFKIEKNIFNKVDLCLSEEMWLENSSKIDNSSVISCKRIGIDSHGEEWANKPLRFYIYGNIYVSRRCKTAEKNHENIHSA